MKRLGLISLFFTGFQLIITIICYEFYWVYRLTNGGIGGTPIKQVHSLIWLVLLVELIISLYLIFKTNIKDIKE